jgi:uncharacterized protein (DUF1330 family)
MPKGYWIGRVDVNDLEQYQKYIDSNGSAFAKYGAKFLVRGDQFENVEGTSRARNVVIEFPDYQSALDCYNSEVYSAAKAHRLPASEADIIIIEGYEG